MKKKSIWKKHSVFSIRLRNQSLALIQTLDELGKVAVFKLERDSILPNSILKKEDVLFMCWVTKAIFHSEQIVWESKMKACPDLTFPTQMISIAGGLGAATFWKGSAHERTILTYRGDPKYISTSVVQKNGQQKIKHDEINNGDYERVRDLEMDAVRSYPEFFERLNLCSEKDENFDPLKEIVFQRNLGLECATYLDIIGGRVPIAELGY
jgi:hypothetical protein